MVLKYPLNGFNYLNAFNFLYEQLLETFRLFDETNKSYVNIRLDKEIILVITKIDNISGSGLGGSNCSLRSKIKENSVLYSETMLEDKNISGINK